MSEQYLVCRNTLYNCYYEKIGNTVTNITNELPFEIPNNWTWIRLKSAGSFGMGQTILTKNMISSGDPVYSATIDNKPLGFINHIDNKIQLEKGDLVIPARGASIGFTTLVKDDSASCTQTTMYIKLFDKTLSNFFYLTLHGLKDVIFKISGSAQPQITIGDVSNAFFPIPPYKEQIRITNKIKQIDYLLLKYKGIETQLSLLETSFEKKLKASVLQYAIEGKLVKQDPNDEPASKLLERIKTEKEKLIREGKIKRDKNESEIIIGDDKNYYVSKALPASWVLVKAKQLTKKIQYGLSISGQKSGKYKLLRITDIQKGQVNWNTLPFCDISEQKYIDYKIERDDIFIARTGGTIGKSFRLVESKENVVFAGYLIRFQLIFNSLSEYISRYLNSPAYWKQVSDKSMGTGQPNINGVSLGNLVIPLPPVSEQKRINNKINKLFCIIKSY